MKKGVKKGLFISGAVAAVLAAVILVLALIPIKTIKNLHGYSHVFVMNGYNSPMEEREEITKAINSSLKDVKFSVMRGILEGDLNYKIKNAKETKEDAENSKKIISVTELREVKPDENGYMLMFVYDAPRTDANFKDENGDKILHDHILLKIPKGNGNIQKITLYPYLSASTLSNHGNPDPDDNGVVDARFYDVYEFTAKAFTSDLYYNLKDALAKLD